jgi:hypothetical protein
MKGAGIMAVNKAEIKEGSMFEHAAVILFQDEHDMLIRDNWLVGSLHSTITYHSFPE